jgi:hypothetical protein
MMSQVQNTLLKNFKTISINKNAHGFKAAVTATEKWGKEKAENPNAE